MPNNSNTENAFLSKIQSQVVLKIHDINRIKQFFMIN